MDYAEFFEGVVHEPTQTGGEGFDLTVARISEVTAAGRIDFGGGEIEPADTAALPTEKREPGDDYGWWHLDAGRYLFEHNESIPSDEIRFAVRPRTELLERGASHPSIRVTDLPRMPLAVGGAGLRLKENARVSTVVAAEPA